MMSVYNNVASVTAAFRQPPVQAATRENVDPEKLADAVDEIAKQVATDLGKAAPRKVSTEVGERLIKLVYQTEDEKVATTFSEQLLELIEEARGEFASKPPEGDVAVRPTGAGGNRTWEVSLSFSIEGQ